MNHCLPALNVTFTHNTEDPTLLHCLQLFIYSLTLISSSSHYIIRQYVSPLRIKISEAMFEKTNIQPLRTTAIQTVWRLCIFR